MSDVERALSQLAFIQERLTASTRFHGFAPPVVALTGIMAFALAGAQTEWPAIFGAEGIRFVTAWVAVAVASAALIGVEALDRSRRLHGGLANLMMAGTLKLLLPFGAAGAVVTLVLFRNAPETIWMLPGLWQLLVALIGFAAIGTLPHTITWPAAWYFACGTATLLIGAATGAPTPWMMGVPFGIGQLMVAATLHRARVRDVRR